ncbi:hypothetical protein GCM10011410_01460 [Hoyosella rhizosphaerae]|uniref:Uncharacterized protein n=1 Tax=Hoyosella rhizosphaerae TaxID=1755582 RepID=A0A916TZ34_9ACTN|nr:hypothetical protein GCM10011410_01460 [Hoyosella rhizosphaerae]
MPEHCAAADCSHGTYSDGALADAGLARATVTPNAAAVVLSTDVIFFMAV